MAINYLNSIDLNRNELQDAQLIRAQVENQPNDASAGTGEEGQLYYDTTLDVLKVWAGGSWSEVGGGVETLTTTDGTYIDLTPNSAVSGPVTVTADLSAVDGTASAASRFLTKDNTWATVPQGDITALTEGTYIGIDNPGGPIPTINHDLTTRTDSTATETLSYGGTFQVYTDVASNTTGHVTDSEVTTFTLPALSTITLTGEVTGSGTTSISTTVANNVLDVANFNASAIVTVAEGIENNDNDTTLPTSAAVKAYVDSAVVGGLVYQGGYNAATNTPDLDSSPSTSIKKGWTYTVTADGLFFTEQVRVGDVIIAEIDAPTALADWTTVQNNVDLADLTTVGIGNVNAESTVNLKGIAVSYNAGTAKVGLDIAALGVDPLAETPNNYFIAIYNAADDENKKVASGDLLKAINSATSKAYTISDTATITYPFTLTAATQNDTIIQLVDTVTNETVYADVDRISTSQATVTFASTPTNSVRVLVQKIG